MLLGNSIIGVANACEKLKKAMSLKYPTTSKSQYEVGVDPTNGKYTIVAFLSDPEVIKRMPSSVDGYKVFDGFQPFKFDETGSEDA